MAQSVDAAKTKNPFTPVFGKVPPYLAGRERIIDNIVQALNEPDNNPDRCSIFVGARGTGKTALLTYLAWEAEARGWVAANITAAPGMLDDVLEQSIDAARHLIEAPAKRTLTEIGIAPLGNVSWQVNEDTQPSWRLRMNNLLDQLERSETGLLITVDEVDPSLDEMAQLVTAYQHFIREDRRVVLLMAGLPHRVSALLSGKSTSFLRRASRQNLGSIPRYEVEEAFRLTIADGGRSIDQDALTYAADAIEGFPFMFQLVGYRSWNAAGTSDTISLEHVRHGANLAQEELEERIFDATISELSPGDMAFLKVMAESEPPIRQRDLRERLNKSSSYVSTYKRRLLEAGVIEEPRRGVLTFALPGFGEYVRANA